jgi:hypothetical protein
MKRNVIASVIACFAFGACGIAVGQEYGNLSGTFIYDGTPPVAAKLSITKDVEVCGKFDLVDESLTVNPSNNGLANVAVYLYLSRRDTPPKPHASYADTASAKVELDNLHCAFTPRVALLQTSQTLVIGNKDPIGHNTKIDCVQNAAINPIVPAGEQMEKQFKEQERVPVRVSCNIHPWMSGWLLVRDNPYFAVSDEDGKFEIKNIPAGKWTFQFWHEKPGYVESVVTKEGKQTWKKGRYELTIKPGENDLGEIKVPASAFK